MRPVMSSEVTPLHLAHVPIADRGESFALIGIKQRRDLLMRGVHRFADPLLRLLSNGIELRRRALEDWPDLRCLLRRKLQLAPEMFPHALAHKRPVLLEDGSLLVSRPGKQPGRNPRAENDDEREREPQFQRARHCQAAASISESAMA